MIVNDRKGLLVVIVLYEKTWTRIGKLMDIRNKQLFYSQNTQKWKSDRIQVIKQHKDKQMLFSDVLTYILFLCTFSFPPFVINILKKRNVLFSVCL